MSGNPAFEDRNATVTLFICTFAIGVLALAAGLIVNYERQAMYGIAIGCMPTGALGASLAVWLPRWVERNRPDLNRRKANALDERSVQLRRHAGYTAFWALFLATVIYTTLSTTQVVRSVSHTAAGIVALYICMTAYGLTVLFHKRK